MLLVTEQSIPKNKLVQLYFPKVMAFAQAIGSELNVQFDAYGSLICCSTIAGSGVQDWLDYWHKGEVIHRAGFRQCRSSHN